jgi:Zn finger protein HypA/HybF involved in hydrogenase expression
MPSQASERRRRYHERKENGYCPRCGKRLSRKVKTIYCDECKSYFSRYNGENSETINETRRNTYTKRKRTKKCPRCGKVLDRGYKKTLCVECLEKQYEYNTGRKRPLILDLPVADAQAAPPEAPRSWRDKLGKIFKKPQKD